MSTETGRIPEARLRECESLFPGDRPGRVTGEGTHLYRVRTEQGEEQCRVSGAFRHGAGERSAFPAVGDFVALAQDGGVIDGLLPRRSVLSRKSAGRRTEEQVLAANVDLVFVVAALDGGRNFTGRGIERYVTTVWESGARPVLVLNKLDACADPAAYIVAAEEAAPGVPVLLTSALTGDGLTELQEAVVPGETAVMIGPSGVGKSSLINSLIGTEQLETGAQREHDRRGRHTSTARQMVLLENGGQPDRYPRTAGAPALGGRGVPGPHLCGPRALRGGVPVPGLQPSGGAGLRGAGGGCVRRIAARTL